MSPPIRHIARAIVLDPADRLLLIAYTSVHTKGRMASRFASGSCPAAGWSRGKTT